MSQAEVLKYMKKVKKPVTTAELNKKFKFNNASPNLARLYKQKLIKRIITKNRYMTYTYVCLPEKPIKFVK